MAIEVLGENQVWGEGAELWLLPQKKSEHWHRLDWLLNFQLSNASIHSAKTLPPQVSEILLKSGLASEISPPPSSGPLLISASGFIPSSWVVVAENPADAKATVAFVEQVYQVWQKLGRLKMRIFLPESLNASQFKKIWSSHFSSLAEAEAAPLQVVNH